MPGGGEVTMTVLRLPRGNDSRAGSGAPIGPTPLSRSSGRIRLGSCATASGRREWRVVSATLENWTVTTRQNRSKFERCRQVEGGTGRRGDREGDPSARTGDAVACDG